MVRFGRTIVGCTGCFEQAGVVADDVQDQEQSQDPVDGLGRTRKARNTHGKQCNNHRQVEQLEEPKQPSALLPFWQVEDGLPERGERQEVFFAFPARAEGQ